MTEASIREAVGLTGLDSAYPNAVAWGVNIDFTFLTSVGVRGYGDSLLYP
jgi:hypothetical protein